MAFTGKFVRNSGEGLTLGMGNHLATLMAINDCQVMRWSEGKPTGEYEAGFQFVFKTQKGGEKVVKEVAANVHDNSNFTKYMSGMAPGVFQKVSSDDDKLAKLMESLIGQSFLLQVGQNQKGRPKIVTILSAGKAKDSEPEPDDVDEDTIPF